MNPLQVPKQGTFGESCPFTGPFLQIYQIPYKYFSKQRKVLLLSKALRKERPSMLPRRWSPMETDAHFQSLT